MTGKSPPGLRSAPARAGRRHSRCSCFACRCSFLLEARTSRSSSSSSRRRPPRGDALSAASRRKRHQVRALVAQLGRLQDQRLVRGRDRRAPRARGARRPGTNRSSSRGSRAPPPRRHAAPSSRRERSARRRSRGSRRRPRPHLHDGVRARQALHLHEVPQARRPRAGRGSRPRVPDCRAAARPGPRRRCSPIPSRSSRSRSRLLRSSIGHWLRRVALDAHLGHVEAVQLGRGGHAVADDASDDRRVRKVTAPTHSDAGEDADALGDELRPVAVEQAASPCPGTPFQPSP